MYSLFMDHQCSSSGWGVLMVDASNAFNLLNRTAMLLQTRVLWSRCAQFLFITYCVWSMLVVQGASECLYSKEGVTQRDPLSKFMCAVGTLPLIRSLCDPSRWTQVWYADDASAGAPCVIFLTGFPFSALRARHMVTFQSLHRVLLSSMSVFVLKLCYFFIDWEFMLCLVIDISEASLVI